MLFTLAHQTCKLELKLCEGRPLWQACQVDARHNLGMGLISESQRFFCGWPTWPAWVSTIPLITCQGQVCIDSEGSQPDADLQSNDMIMTTTLWHYVKRDLKASSRSGVVGKLEKNQLVADRSLRMIFIFCNCLRIAERPFCHQHESVKARSWVEEVNPMLH